MAKVNKEWFRELANGKRGGFRRGIQNGPPPMAGSKRGGAAGRERVQPAQSKPERKLAERVALYERDLEKLRSSSTHNENQLRRPGSLNYH